MYSVIAQSNGKYAVTDSDSGEMEILDPKYLEIALHIGVSIDGCSLNGNGDLEFTRDIRDITDEVENSDLELDEDYGDEDEDEYYDDEDEYENEYEDEDEDENEEGFDFDDDEDDEGFDWSGEAEEDDGEDEDGFYFEDDEDDFIEEEPEESIVSKLYSVMTEEQVKLLKRYYLWYSQRLFTTAQKDPTLGMKSKSRLASKKRDLSNLRNTGGLWHYAGFVDTGYFGGGECTLGHTLRYLHLAWDVSASDIESTFFGERYDNDFEDLIQSNNCIVFGIKCISDFFEVSSDCTRALQAAQRESLKDMEELYEIYTQGIVDEVNSSFEIADAVMKRVLRYDLMADENEQIMINGLVPFYKQFRDNNIPVPRSLMYELRNNLIGWNSGKFYGEIRLPGLKLKTSLKKILAKKYHEYISSVSLGAIRRIDFDCFVTCYISMFYEYRLCGYYCYDGDKNSYEGGRSKNVVYAFKSMRDLVEGVFTDITYDEDCLYEVLRFGNAVEKGKSLLRKHYFTYDEAKEINELREGVTSVRGIKRKGIGIKEHNARLYELIDIVSKIVEDEDRKRKEKEIDKEISSYRSKLRLLGYEKDNVSAVHTFGLFGNGDTIKIGMYRSNNTFGVQSFDLANKEGVDEFTQEVHVLVPLWNDILKNYSDIIQYKETVYNKKISLLETSKTEDIDTNLDFDFEGRVKELENKLSESITKYEDQVGVLREQYNKLDKKGGTDKVDILEYLKNADLSKLDSEFDLNKKIFETCKGLDREPSRRQQYYLDKMYEALTGEMPVHEKSSLSDVEKTACEWITTKYKGDSFAKKVCKTILSKGEYSAKQKRFLDEAIQLMKESSDI